MWKSFISNLIYTFEKGRHLEDPNLGSPSRPYISLPLVVLKWKTFWNDILDKYSLYHLNFNFKDFYVNDRLYGPCVEVSQYSHLAGFDIWWVEKRITFVFRGSSLLS